jgi:predicted alpha/beta superfamily hydrolase
MKNHFKCKHREICFLLFSILSGLILDAKSQDNLSTAESRDYPPVPVPNTELRTIYSNILKQEINLYIKLPSGYYTNPRKIYQAWYFTDANRSFPMIANIESIFDVLPAMSADPEIVIIGIGYAIHDMGDWATWRTRDLTPTSVADVDSFWTKMLIRLTGRLYEVKSGGSERFLECIVQEVFPFVETDYRVSSTQRGIGGYSYGGLFTLYVLFKHPELFSYYYAGSPSISYDHGILYNFEEEYASSHQDLKARLFMSAGAAEDSLMVADVKKMANLLKSRNYAGLDIETEIFPGETHQTCIPSSIMKAFRILYDR